MSSALRLAALYDIHGNLPALEAVLEEIDQLRVDLIVVGGDVLPGPLPRETLECLLSLDSPVGFIHGNGELDIAVDRIGEQSDTLVHGVATLPDRHDHSPLRATLMPSGTDHAPWGSDRFRRHAPPEREAGEPFIPRRVA